MNVFLYQERHKHRQQWCEVCDKNFNKDELTPHHIHKRRNSDKCIWVCFKCHRKIEDNPKWAYENGYSVKQTKKQGYKKRSKNKRCTHKKFIWDNELQSIVCQFCHKELNY